MSGVEVPGRFLPLPVHASEAARAMLAAPSTMAAATPYPADDDKAGWRDHVEAVNAQLIGAMQPMMAGLPVEISDDRIGGVPVFRARPTGGADEGRRSEEHTSELQSLMRISYA